MIASRDLKFPMSFVGATFASCTLRKTLGLNVFANQLYNVFANRCYSVQ